MKASRDGSINHHRALTQKRLVRLLKQTNSEATLDEIESVIFNEEVEHPFIEYVMYLIERFGPEADNHIDALLPAIQDAWNYFPHNRLNGSCPAELILQQAPWLKPSDLR